MNEPTPETVAPLPAHLDAIRARSEAALQQADSGTLPRIEDQLAGLSEPDRLALLRELVALEVAGRLQRGDKPRAEEYRDRFREALTLKGHTWGVHSVAFSPDDKRIASASGNGTVKIYDSEKPLPVQPEQ